MGTIHPLRPPLESREIVRAIRYLTEITDLLANVDAETLELVKLDIRHPVIEARIVLARMSGAIGLPPPGELIVREYPDGAI